MIDNHDRRTLRRLKQGARDRVRKARIKPRTVSAHDDDIAERKRIEKVTITIPKEVTTMGRLSEYDAFERDKLRSNARDERLATVYIEGRNAARSNKPRTVPGWYSDDALAAINWETGYDDYLAEAQGDTE